MKNSTHLFGENCRVSWSEDSAIHSTGPKGQMRSEEVLDLCYQYFFLILSELSSGKTNTPHFLEKLNDNPCDARHGCPLCLGKYCWRNFPPNAGRWQETVELPGGLRSTEKQKTEGTTDANVQAILGVWDANGYRGHCRQIKLRAAVQNEYANRTRCSSA